MVPFGLQTVTPQHVGVDQSKPFSLVKLVGPSAAVCRRCGKILPHGSKVSRSNTPPCRAGSRFPCSGDFALTGRSPRVSLLLDKLLSPKSLLSDSHPSVSKPSSVCYQGLITLEEGTITEGLIWFRVESYHVVAADGKIFWLSAAPT